MAEVKPKELFQYVAEDGRCLFKDWMGSLRDVMAKARIRARLARLRAGNPGDYRSLGEGLYELRIDHGPGYRIYYGEAGGFLVILLCGGDKSSQTKDINVARALWAEYGRREHDHAS